MQKLQSVLEKVFGRFGTIVRRYYPVDETTQMFKGYVYIQWNLSLVRVYTNWTEVSWYPYLRVVVCSIYSTWRQEKVSYLERSPQFRDVLIDGSTVPCMYPPTAIHSPPSAISSWSSQRERRQRQQLLLAMATDWTRLTCLPSTSSPTLTS